VKVKYKIYNLPFRYPFTISKGTKTHQPGLLVELDFRGLRGYGEAPAITYYQITVEQMAEELDQKRDFVERFAFTDPARYWHYLHHLFPKNSFLVCALDMAGWDLFGKMRNKPLYEYFGANPAQMPETDYTIGIDTAEGMVEKMKENPWPFYKVKVGTEGDMQRLRLLREHTRSRLRVDANAGWNVRQALEAIPLMADLGVELVEQPLPVDDWEGMKLLFQKSPIPLFADESCVSEKDVEACAGYFHGINIKLTKCGGITPALRMIKEARRLGLKIMLGCMNESIVGTAAMAHLAPLVDYLDADGPLLLAGDLASGLEYQQGKIIMSGKPGLGIDLLSAI
jgi:L-alanine-DL-glutamate epimerase-like enolase superfamily enzyme